MKRIVLPIALLIVLSTCDKKDPAPDYTNNIEGTTWESTVKGMLSGQSVNFTYSWVFTNATSGQLVVKVPGSQGVSFSQNIDFTYTYSGGKGTIKLPTSIVITSTNSGLPFSIAGDTLTVDEVSLKKVAFKRK